MKNFTLMIMIVALCSLSTFTISASGLPALGQYKPNDDAAVKIEFDGMAAIFFGADDRVSVGILNAVHHTPLFTITRVAGSEKRVVATLNADQLHGSLFVDVDGSHQSVSRYEGTGKLSISDPADFRHVLNFNQLYPGKKLTILEDRLWGKIHLRAGLFYAANLTDTPVRFFDAKGQGRTLNVSRRMADPEGKIFLRVGESLIISGDKIETIRLKAEDGVRYELSITNLPPEDMANMEHFLFYYDLIEQRLDRYVPVQSFKASYRPTPMLCAETTFTENNLSVP